MFFPNFFKKLTFSENREILHKLGKSFEMKSKNLSRTLNQSIFRLTCQVRAHNLRFGHGSSQKDEKDTYGYIYVHMDTHGYIKWIHMGAQEPGCGTKLAAGPWAHGQGQGLGPWTGPGPKGPWTGPGPMGPWPTSPTPGRLML